MKYMDEFALDNMTFRIRPLTAADGIYLFLYGSKKLLPLLSAMEDETAGDAIPEPRPDISKAELEELQDLCLAQIDICLDAGWTPVYRAGLFAVESLEYSPKAVLLLCLRVIRLVLQDFFGESALPSA